MTDGKPSTDDEIDGSTLTFQPTRLTIQPRSGAPVIYDASIEDGSVALVAPDGKRGWMKYELRGTMLRLAFYDGLGSKPPAFEPEPGRNGPTLVVLHLVRD